MKVLIACEESQEVCKAFRKRGHEAWSCDIVDCSGGHPEWHLKMDAFDAVELMRWDMIIAHPPCTYLTVSNNKAMTHGCKKYTAEQGQQYRKDAIEFFLRFTKLDTPLCIENPIGIMSTIYRKPDQIVQPWQFGHPETKATCLWLNGLTKLVPTNIVEGREQRIWKLSPSADRAKIRSKTFQGIAEAMADQWG